ncbi:acyl-coenzyme A diphosphatase NUDT19 [Pteronotus mesoamericanus]|uniref:acyl-coenzyme A diphosphatase NUDT19 n=1 Tax=Pteronotus mesoamericanus TaxID=1884717 RepID=UPI0023EBB41F|nr:acyl-coenzyme A diphosphatase NUDT19 [Pteronotus parnellii mesoamericanus]
MSSLLRSTSSSWRRAATVVLVAGWTHPSLAAPSLPPLPDEGFRLLLQQRSKQLSFFPGAHVFPGGAVDPADSSADWLRLFAPHHGPPRFGLGLAPLQRTTFPELPAAGPATATEDGAALPDDVTFRICALREAFEEAGVLLLRSRASPAALPEPGCALLSEVELKAWRARVHHDARQFLHLCEHLNCTPDIWALHDWSCWLTPFVGRGGRRFETTFYLCFLRELPLVYPDLDEVVSCEWLSPSEATRRFLSKEIFLAPPQFYEIRRFENFASLSDLHKFCLDHILEGVERWMPVNLLTADGRIILLPGDELYLEDSKFLEDNMSSDRKTEEIMKEGKKFHRMVVHSRHCYSIHVTVQSKYKHVYPKTYVVNKSHL